MLLKRMGTNSKKYAEERHASDVMWVLPCWSLFCLSTRILARKESIVPQQCIEGRARSLTRARGRPSPLIPSRTSRFMPPGLFLISLHKRIGLFLSLSWTTTHRHIFMDVADVTKCCFKVNAPSSDISARERRLPTTSKLQTNSGFWCKLKMFEKRIFETTRLKCRWLQNNAK